MGVDYRRPHLGGLGLLHQLHNLGEGGVRAHVGGLHQQGPLGVDGAGDHPATHPLTDGHGLPWRGRELTGKEGERRGREGEKGERESDREIQSDKRGRERDRERQREKRD